MELALVHYDKHEGREIVVTTSVYGRVGSYRNIGIYAEEGDAVAALHEFVSAFPEEEYRLVPASDVAHKVVETYKWVVHDEHLIQGNWDCPDPYADVVREEGSWV